MRVGDPCFVQPKLEGCEKFLVTLNPDKGTLNLMTERDTYFLLPDRWEAPLKLIFEDYPNAEITGHFIPFTTKIYITELKEYSKTTEECVSLLKVLSSIYTTKDVLFLKTVKCNNEESKKKAIQDCVDNGFSEWLVTHTNYRIAR